MEHKLKRTVGFAVLALTVASIPIAVSAATVSATCNTSKSDTQFHFDGSLDAQPGEPGFFRILAHEGVFAFAGDVTDIPLTDAKNDYYVSLHDFNTGQQLFGEPTPDEIPYFDPYLGFPDGWSVREGTLVFGRFYPAFDIRNTPDPHCTADTVLFTFKGGEDTGVECPRPADGACDDLEITGG